MATSSEVKSGLDAIAEAILNQRNVVAKAIQNAQLASDALSALAVDNADVIAEINGFGTVNAFEALSKAELAKMTAEFMALKVNADTIAAIDIG